MLATQNAEETLASTWQARATAEEAIFPECGSTKHIYSPDGNWVVVMCMDIDSSTGIYNRNNPSQAWRLNYKTIFGVDVPRGAPHFIYPWHWTADGQYVYLSIYPCCLDGGCPEYLSGEALVRLDLLTGKVTQTLQPGEGGLKMYYFKISPDDTTLAYLRTWLPHPILNLENLISGEVQHIPLGDQYDEAGYIIWSPDKSHILLSARTGEPCDNFTYYLVMLDLDDFEQTVLLESTSAEYAPIRWTEANQIIVYVNYDKGYITLDLTTGETSPYLTPTPDGNP
jgi:hypothetical protein